MKVGPNSKDKCPCKRYSADKHTGEEAREDRGRDRSDAATAKEAKSGENQGRSLRGTLQRERGPADTLISDFQPPELSENKFLLV